MPLRLLVLCSLFLAACGDDAPARRPATETEFEPVQLVGGIAWRVEAPLLGRRPTSEMRTAEYAVSGHPDAELVVFHFRTEEGAEGGSVDENVGRWLDQFEQPDGRPTRDVAELDEREIDGRRVTIVRTTGTFSGLRGAGAEEHVEDYALYGAIVEAPEGLVFFKLLGPRAAVGAAAHAFESMLDSIRMVSN